MLSKSIKYFIILILSFILSIFAYFIIKQSKRYIDSQKYKKMVDNFLTGKDLSKINSPLLCFQSANQLSSNHKIIMPEFITIGSLPDSKSDIKKKIDFDVFGFRNNNEIWKDKEEEKFLVLGDSVVMSSYLEQEKLFTAILNNKSIPAINLGCNGNGVLSNSWALVNFLESEYRTKNIYFFLNLNNDLSKDTWNEHKSNYFKSFFSNDLSIRSIFDNREEYKKEYINFTKEIFKEEIKVKNTFFSLTLFSIFMKEKFKPFFDLINKKKDVTLINARLSEDQIANNIYSAHTFILFLEILEKLKYLSVKNNLKITFVLVPGHKEIETYREKEKSNKLSRLYWTYRQTKNDTMNMIANYDFPIIDLYTSLKSDTHNIYFNKGHFTREGHSFLASIIAKDLKSEQSKKLQKLIFFNSHYPSQNFHPLYADNFDKQLSESQIEQWLILLLELYNEKEVDVFLFSPFLAYSLVNGDCKTINYFINNLNNEHKNSAPALLFKGICELNKKDFNNSISLIKKSIAQNVRYYFPTIVEEILIEIAKYEKEE